MRVSDKDWRRDEPRLKTLARLRKFIYWKLHKQELCADPNIRRMEGNRRVDLFVKEQVYGKGCAEKETCGA